MNKTLKEIYGWDIDDKPSTSLIRHVNDVLMKTPDELNAHDINMLIRQGFFLDTVIPKAIRLIENDHAVGDYYKYCMLVNLSEVQVSLSEYKNDIANLISILKKDYQTTNFETERERDDYLGSIKRLSKKIQ